MFKPGVSTTSGCRKNTATSAAEDEVAALTAAGPAQSSQRREDHLALHHMISHERTQHARDGRAEHRSIIMITNQLTLQEWM